MKRALLILLAAVVLTAWLLPASAENGRAFRWSLSFQTAAPGDTAADRAWVDLLNALSAEGTWADRGGAFTLDGRFWLDEGRRSETAFRLYGREDRWIAESPLLGGTSLMFNNPAMVEYGNKIHDHLGFPVQRLPLLYPYVWKDALAAPIGAWNEYIHVPESGGTVPLADLIDFIKRLNELSQTDRAFRHLLKAVFGDDMNPVSSPDFPRRLADWLNRLAPDGFTVTRDSEGETWDSGQWVVFRRRNDGSQTVFSFPNPLGGEMLRLSDESDGQGGREIRIVLGIGGMGTDVRLTVSPEGSVVLTASGDQISSLPFLSLRESANGPVLHASSVADAGGVLSLRLDPVADGYVLRDRAGSDLLRIRLTVTDTQPAEWPAWQISDLNGVNFFSLDDSSLRELTQQVFSSFLSGGVRLVAYAPAATVVFIMDWVEDHFLSEAAH